MEAPQTDAAPAVRGDNDWVDARTDVAWAAIARRVLTVSAGCCLVALVAWSAVLTKTADRVMPLASVRLEPLAESLAEPLTKSADETANEAVVTQVSLPPRREASRAAARPAAMASGGTVTDNPWANDPDVRWFNGRPAKPDRTLKMRVTAYSPDHRSCGDSADGFTATMHSVETNGFKLVAADPKVLPYGSMVSIEGYDRGQIVPVLDCGGAIKGHHIDLLFPTHEEARQWGNKWMDVTVWKYLDGKPQGDPRKER
jgi:3D (Asp-Asp-Asp) domain-containing protein